jgi:hypothetical protein
VLLGAPVAPSRLLSGFARSLQGRDADAIAAWQEALKAGVPRPLIAPLLLDAHVRRSDYAAGSSLIAETTATPADPSWLRNVAAVAIATNREADAIKTLDTHLAKHPNDQHARWLRLQALYTQIVNGDASKRALFESDARSYSDAKGVNAALAADWLAALGQ